MSCCKCEVELCLSADILSIRFYYFLNLILKTKLGHYISVSWISSISTVFSWNSFWLCVLFWTFAEGLGGLGLSKGPSKGLFQGSVCFNGRPEKVKEFIEMIKQIVKLSKFQPQFSIKVETILEKIGCIPITQQNLRKFEFQ